MGRAVVAYRYLATQSLQFEPAPPRARRFSRILGALWYLFCLVVVLINTAFAQPIDVETRIDQKNFNQLPLTLHHGVYYQITPLDQDAESLVQDPASLHKFSAITGAEQMFRPGPHQALWLLVRLYSDTKTPLFLSYDYRLADEFTAYRFEREHGSVHLLLRSGTALPFHERLIPSRTHAIELPFAQQPRQEILIRITQPAVIPAKFVLSTARQFQQQQFTDNFSDGLFLGFMLLIAIHNLLLLLKQHERLYGYFAGFFASFALLVAVLNGSVFALVWPQMPEINSAMVFMSCGSCLCFLSLLNYRMLAMRAQLQHRGFLLFNLLWSFALLFSPLYADIDQRLWLLERGSFVVLTLNFLQAFWFGIKRNSKVRWLGLSWIVFYGTGMLLFLANFGYLPQSPLWHWLLALSLVCTLLIMSNSLILTYTPEQDALMARQASELQHYHDIYHTAVEGHFTTTMQGQLLHANRALLQILGYQDIAQMQHDVQQHGMGRYYADAADRLHLLRQLQHQGAQTMEFRGVKADGSPFWALILARLTRVNGQPDLIHGSVIDITQQKIAHEQLAYLASHDPLTGLFNRHHFEHLTYQAWQQLQLQGTPSALLYLDIDQFNLVNNTCQHSAGDALLKQLSDKMRFCLGNQGAVARLGGDDFAVLLSGIPASAAFPLAYRLLDEIKAFRFIWQDSVFQISVSIGLCDLALDDLSARHSISKADNACLQAKAKGRNRIHLFDPAEELTQPQGTELRWAQQLQQALEKDELELFVQPIMTLQGNTEQLNQGLHYELLLRLRTADQQYIPPSHFLIAAERFGLMPHIDRWVCKTYVRYLAQQPQIMAQLQRCHINISGASLLDPLFANDLQDLFDEYHVSPSLICFEISESMALLHLQPTLDFIQRFRPQGCRFALDDFGSGFSSYGYLKTLPVDYLKIDGTFISHLAFDGFDRAIVQSIHDVASAMGMQTIAEHCENQDILQLLHGIGVHHAQGFALGKPQPLGMQTPCKTQA